MLPPLSPQIAIEALNASSDRPLHENADYAHHLAMQAAPETEHMPWALRLLPRPLRKFLKARIDAYRYERDLINAWQKSPHLLEDMGVILSRKVDLPDHLVAAPARVIEHVAASAPEQIVQAEAQYPLRPAAPQEVAEPQQSTPGMLRPRLVRATV